MEKHCLFFQFPIFYVRYSPRQARLRHRRRRAERRERAKRLRPDLLASARRGRPNRDHDRTQTRADLARMRKGTRSATCLHRALPRIGQRRRRERPPICHPCYKGIAALPPEETRRDGKLGHPFSSSRAERAKRLAVITLQGARRSRHGTCAETCRRAARCAKRNRARKGSARRALASGGCTRCRPRA